jgi:hypothetical protein
MTLLLLHSTVYYYRPFISQFHFFITRAHEQLHNTKKYNILIIIITILQKNKESIMLSSNFVPNLPGFKPHEVYKSGKKMHYLKMSADGHRFVGETEQEMSNYDLNSSASIASLGSTSPGKHNQCSFSNFDILKFDAEFDRGRKASILYYTEDDSIKIVELPEENSGINQGVFLRRSIVPRSDGSSMTLDDLSIGEEVTIFGRQFYITDCNDNTRDFLRSIGRQVPPSEKQKNIQEMKSQMNSRDWGKFRTKKNELKLFMEAKLGNTVNTKGREGFMEHGTKTLKFLCSWDDREMLYGDRNQYILVYHLADNTIEIFNAPSPNSPKQFPKLLRRSHLPKQLGSSSLIGDVSTPDGSPIGEVLYHWSDFYIGCEVNCYSRILLIIDADSKTREFFRSNELPLGEAIKLDADVVPFSFTREIPPHTGFGSEEDSLKSCVGPLNPTSSVFKTNITESRVFMFFAKLVSVSDSIARKFVITFYKQDGTVKIQEPPLRNSGYVGGLFLSRRRVKRYGTNDYMTERDFIIGKEVKILTHTFEITGANDFTYKWMDSEGLLDQGESKE